LSPFFLWLDAVFEDEEEDEDEDELDGQDGKAHHEALGAST
jgi:hypothetical protein